MISKIPTSIRMTICALCVVGFFIGAHLTSDYIYLGSIAVFIVFAFPEMSLLFRSGNSPVDMELWDQATPVGQLVSLQHGNGRTLVETTKSFYNMNALNTRFCLDKGTELREAKLRNGRRYLVLLVDEKPYLL